MILLKKNGLEPCIIFDKLLSEGPICYLTRKTSQTIFSHWSEGIIYAIQHGSEIYHDNRFAIQSFVQVSLCPSHCRAMCNREGWCQSTTLMWSSEQQHQHFKGCGCCYSNCSLPWKHLTALFFAIAAFLKAKSSNWHKKNLPRF